MAKRRPPNKRAAKPLSAKTPAEQLQTLVAKKQYRTALNKLKQWQREQPDLQLSPSEAELWLLEGQQEFEQGQYARAESAFRQALTLGLNGAPHYWLAKTLLAQDQPEPALALVEEAFERKLLPKDYAGCYLKLLFLNDRAEQAAALIEQQAKRFYAPHLHWTRGILALQAGEPEAAYAHFKKMGRATTAGDWPVAWLAYAQQQAGQWENAQQLLGLLATPFRFGAEGPMPARHPAIAALRVVQAVETGLSLPKTVDLKALAPHQREAAVMLEMLHLIDQGDYHNAAHLALSSAQLEILPATADLYRPLMLLAGKQSLEEQEPGCAETFWSRVVDQPSFDPNLALHLCPVLDANQSYAAVQRLVNQLIQWLQPEAKRHPQDWPEERLKPTLAKLHCWLADSLMAQNKSREAERAMQQAEKLVPDLPDLIGRRGLQAYTRGRTKQAIPLLNQALEAGCRYDEVYHILLECYEDADDQPAIKAARQKFGKFFGDLATDLQVEIPAWVEALSFRNYALFEDFVLDQTWEDPAVQAYEIFLDAAEDDPSPSQRVTLDQAAASEAWDELLQALTPAAKIPVLQAIFLAIQLHAKRKKGIADLQSRYLLQMIELKTQHPEAALPHLLMLVMKGLKPDRLTPPLQAYLAQADQPGTALAQLQLQVMRFSDTDVLRPFIEAQLQQDSHNPQLLLAQASTYPVDSDTYKNLREQGFELARRLQDAQALQAFREEEYFRAAAVTRSVVPDLSKLRNPSQMDMVDILQQMARQIFGQDVPPELILQLLPELEAQMANGFSDFDEEDVFPDDLESFFSRPPAGKSKKSSKRKRGFSF